MPRSGVRASATMWRSAAAVLLGLSGRRAQAPGAERTRRGSSASSYEAPVGATDMQFGRAYWLPPFGHGNGLEALFWAPVARLPEASVDAALRAFREEDIAAWAAAVRNRSAVPSPKDAPHDLWVAAERLDAAHDVLLRVLAA